MVIGAVLVLVRGGAQDGTSPSTPPPSIQWVAPAPGAVLEGPFAIEFRVGAGELTRMPDGWGLGDMHLHVDVDGTSFMPASTDLEREPDGSYRWTFSALGPGEHSLRLYWSDLNHLPIQGGGSTPVQVTSR